MLLFGMVGSALIFSELLRNFDEIRLIQVIQGVAVTQMLLNIAALWKQEARNPSLHLGLRARPEFQQSWARFRRSGALDSRPCRARAGYLCLLDAGYSAGAVWWRNPANSASAQTTALTAFFALGTSRVRTGGAALWDATRILIASRASAR